MGLAIAGVAAQESIVWGHRLYVRGKVKGRVRSTELSPDVLSRIATDIAAIVRRVMDDRAREVERFVM